MNDVTKAKAQERILQTFKAIEGFMDVPLHRNGYPSDAACVAS
ncbi:MAG: hypothetical protein ABF629_07030 [Sporolactobacillus sp.]